MAAVPFPGLQEAEVSTYPLKVVAESAVITSLGFSSACVTAGRLTSPAPTNPNVHPFNFMCILINGCVVFTVAARSTPWVETASVTHWPAIGTCYAKQKAKTAIGCKGIVYIFLGGFPSVEGLFFFSLGGHNSPAG